MRSRIGENKVEGGTHRGWMDELKTGSGVNELYLILEEKVLWRTWTAFIHCCFGDRQWKGRSRGSSAD